MEFWWWRSLCCLVLLYFKATASSSSSSSRPLCTDHDKSALLQFKHSFQIDCAASAFNPSPYPITKSWIDGPNADCCLWEGVGCHQEIGTVIKLDLSSSCLYGSFPQNSSLFRLIHLQNLNLAFNDFNYSQIPFEVGQLRNLQSLNLSSSAFRGQIPSEISKLLEISVLDLSSGDNDNALGNDNQGLKLQNPTLEFLLRNLTRLSHISLYKVDISSILPTFLTNFTSLREINLALTGVYGEVPANFFRLPHLETVLLSGNGGLKGVFPEFQFNSRLTEIDLRSTSFYGELPHSIGNLAHLKKLRLQVCQFSGPIPSSIGNLTSLTYLNLDNNEFTGNIPLSITNLTSVRTLGLSDPNTMSPQMLLRFSKLHRLTSLRLLGIHLDSEMPSCLANFTGLTFLDLGMTGLKGELPSWFANLTQLQQLFLNDNLFEGPIPQWFSQFTSLNYLELSGNLFGNFDMFFGLQNLVALGLSGVRLTFTSTSKKNSSVFNLQWLDLSSCNLTEVPRFLQHQTELQVLFLHGNNIKGVIPQWLINTTKESLLIADFGSNMLTGFEQPVSVLPWTNLKALDISDNEWQGALPTPPSSLLIYSAANNAFKGNIPKDICRARFLRYLDLSNSSISGSVPSCLGHLLGESLEFFNLRGNNLSGTIPLTFTDVCALKMINLSENKLQDDLPRSLSNCTMLEIIDVGKNSFSGTFPSWLGRLPKLQVLVLRHNKFHGSIEDPKEGYEFPFLRIVDLSNNLFIGHLSTVYLQNWHKMQVSDEDNSDSSRSVIDFDIDAGSDEFIDTVQLDYSMTITNKGSETLYTKILTVFRVIDFSSNKFTGKIPDVIGDLVGLQALNLSNNNLVGEIPSTLANMTDLESLDLSMNMLSGEIPQGLSQLKSLEVFNVSYNHLRGPIPQGEQFNTFDNSSYKGNTELCGFPLSKNCNKVDATPSSLPSVKSDKMNGDSELIDWIVRSFGCLSGFIIGYVIGKLYITDKYHEWFTEKFQRRPKKRVARKPRHRR